MSIPTDLPCRSTQPIRLAVSLFAALLLAATPVCSAAAPAPFGLEQVDAMARALAAKPYASQQGDAGAFFSSLDYDQYNQIHFDPQRLLWRDQKLPFTVDFFHPGYRFPKTVAVNEIVDGQPMPLPFKREFYTYGNLAIPANAVNPEGYTGLRFHSNLDGSGNQQEFLVFLGASYFRAVALGIKYGQSARGIAINTGERTPEEFPGYETFWLVRPAPNARTLTLYALLNGPSATGAYQFDVSTGNVTLIEVRTAIYLRQPVKVFGAAPLTGMFWFGENSRSRPYDFRPKVHDCDGLLIATRGGDWQWRTLDVARYVRHSSFPITDPAGFGLVQRDRRFESYLDTWSQYERRPTVWVEPVGDWGSGRINLVEIPTENENEDNIVAFWTPDKLPTATEPLRLHYRLHWGTQVPEPAALSKVLSTRQGLWYQHEETYFAVDFDKAGSPSDKLPEAKVSAAPEAEISDVQVQPNPQTGGWLVRFRAALKPGEREATLSAQLFRDDKAISEQWNYLWSAAP